jgi:hypothetical protein
MEEQERVTRQVLDRDFDDVPGAREPCMSMSYAPLGLEAPRPQPLVREGEALATVVVLLVFHPNRTSALEDRAVRRHAVGNARDELRQVQRRIGVMAHAEKEGLPVPIVYPPDGTCGNVGRKGERIGSDAGSLGSGRREGVGVVASQYTG